jgi:hypothetical protein
VRTHVDAGLGVLACFDPVAARTPHLT